MKIHRIIFIFTTLIIFNACNSYKKEDLDYFESASQEINSSIIALEKYIQVNLRGLETRIKRHKAWEQDSNDLEKFIEKADNLTRKVIDYKEKIERLKTELNNYAKEHPSHKHYSALSLLENLDETNQELKKCLDFLVENYADLLSPETKHWHQNAESLLERELKGLPLYGGVCKLSQIQYQLLEDNRRIVHHILEKVKIISGYRNFRLHLSAEKNKVKLGENYKASIQFAEVASPRNLEMKIDGKNIKVENGIGKLRLKTQGLGKKIHKGEIKAINGVDEDTTFRIEKEIYEVIPKK